MVLENKNQYFILKLDETQNVTFCTVLSLSPFFFETKKKDKENLDYYM